MLQFQKKSINFKPHSHDDYDINTCNRHWALFRNSKASASWLLPISGHLFQSMNNVSCDKWVISHLPRARFRALVKMWNNPYLHYNTYMYMYVCLFRTTSMPWFCFENVTSLINYLAGLIGKFIILTFNSSGFDQRQVTRLSDKSSNVQQCNKIRGISSSGRALA